MIEALQFRYPDPLGRGSSFFPLDLSAYGYDPYYFLRTSPNPAQEARAIAQSLIPLPPDTREPFWIESAHNVFAGAILHFYTNFNFYETLLEVAFTPPQDLISVISQSHNAKARLCVGSYVGMSESTLASIFSELSKNIIPLVTDENIIGALVGGKNITPEDLEYGYDVFIQIPEHLLRQWKNLLTLIVNQFLTHFERRAEGNNSPILFMLDEFPRLGKIPAILDGLATLRSKNISICLVAQSLAQLDTVYGTNERKVIADTCSYKAILGATDADTQEYFSRLVGTYDKATTSHGTTKAPYTGLRTSSSVNTYEQERRIIKPEEFGELDYIVLLTPYGAMSVEKLPYWL
jgi:type IV secretion system protein VirD4